MYKFHPSCLRCGIRVRIPTLKNQMAPLPAFLSVGFSRISRTELGKRLRGGIEFCAFPCRVRTGKTQHRPKQYSKIRKECACPRILQGHFQFDGQNSLDVLLLDRTLVKQPSSSRKMREARSVIPGGSAGVHRIPPGNNRQIFPPAAARPLIAFLLQSTFTSCGSSSSLYLRKKCPTRVMRASSRAVNRLPPTLWVNMLRNLSRRNFRRPLPTRNCE